MAVVQRKHGILPLHSLYQLPSFPFPFDISSRNRRFRRADTSQSRRNRLGKHALVTATLRLNAVGQRLSPNLVQLVDLVHSDRVERAGDALGIDRAGWSLGADEAGVSRGVSVRRVRTVARGLN